MMCFLTASARDASFSLFIMTSRPCDSVMSIDLMEFGSLCELVHVLRYRSSVACLGEYKH
jgi:hypothetical protein